MRLSFTGLSCFTDQKFIEKFVDRWPDYLQAGKNFYTPDDMSLVNSQEEQWESLDEMVELMQDYRNNDHVFFTGSPIDNLVYSMWANAKGYDIDDEFIQRCMPIVSESMRFLDIIFYNPDSKFNNIEIDEQYHEISHLYSAIMKKFSEDEAPFFPKDDRPPVIELFGDVESKIEIISLYMDDQGDSIGAQGIIDPSELEDLEKAFGIK
tara:strand:+ start:1039 stop:1662 length:624 start_codon:yes stop_codon:yes gene_type:complete